MTTLKMSITNDQGEVYAILSRDFDGRWVDEDGDLVFSDHAPQQQIGYAVQDFLAEAVKWAQFRANPYRVNPYRNPADAEPEPGPTEEQVIDWNIANDHQDRGEDEA